MQKVQKIMIDAGFTCPNRDGSRGWGGCTFCRNDSFNPSYCKGSIKEQIESGKRFFAGKYPEMKFLAYFQAFSNTYAPLGILKSRYEEALNAENVIGLVIGTRPDCIDEMLLAYLKELQADGKEIIIELGVESFYNRTLQRINRGHDSECSRKAIIQCANAGLVVGIHMIFGLPGETKNEILHETEIINELPINRLKIHQLQILKETPMAIEWEMHRSDFLSLNVEQYAQLVADFVHNLRPDIEVERFASSAPSELVIAPRWGLKPYEVQRIIEKKLAENSFENY